MNQLFNEWLAELPTILDSLFHKVVNTTSTPIRVEGRGGGEPQSSGLFQFKNFIWPNNINSGCFYKTHMLQNVAKSMPSLTSNVYVDFLLAVYLSSR